MGSAIIAAEVALIVLAVLVVLAVAWLWLRRRWLSRTGGTFACSLRRDLSTPSPRWVLGVARYTDQQLQWFPAVSLSVWPGRSFDRAMVRAGSQRRASSQESAVLVDTQRILALEGPSDRVELAMDDNSLTGLLSWLEAAPPGMHYRPTPESPS